MFELIDVMLAFFLVAVFGFFLGRKDIISDSAANQISGILVVYIFGVTMVKSFIRPFNWQELKIIGLVFIVTFLIAFISILVSLLFFKKEDSIERYATIFNNKGFVGIPVISAILGDEFVIYIIPAIIVTNMFVWTYGAKLLGANISFSPKALLLNPSILAFIIGLIIFIQPFEIPDFVKKSMDYLAGLNSPLAMILLGYFLSKESLKAALINLKVWKVNFVRLIIIPIIVMICMRFIPVSNIFFKKVMILAWACPTAMNLSLFVSHSGKDPTYAAQITATSSILSVITIPLIYLLTEYFIK